MNSHLKIKITHRCFVVPTWLAAIAILIVAFVVFTAMHIKVQLFALQSLTDGGRRLVISYESYPLFEIKVAWTLCWLAIANYIYKLWFGIKFDDETDGNREAQPSTIRNLKIADAIGTFLCLVIGVEAWNTPAPYGEDTLCAVYGIVGTGAFLGVRHVAPWFFHRYLWQLWVIWEISALAFGWYFYPVVAWLLHYLELGFALSGALVKPLLTVGAIICVVRLGLGFTAMWGKTLLKQEGKEEQIGDDPAPDQAEQQQAEASVHFAREIGSWIAPFGVLVLVLLFLAFMVSVPKGVAVLLGAESVVLGYPLIVIFYKKFDLHDHPHPPEFADYWPYSLWFGVVVFVAAKALQWTHMWIH